MNLGALLDLGVSSETLVNGLEKLGTGGWRLEITRDQRHGITGTKVTVITDETGGERPADDLSHDDGHTHGDGHHHHHDHDYHDHHHHHHDHHDHDHDHHDHHHQQQQHHHHRNLDDISRIVNGSTLPVEVRELAMKIFRNIAEAESAVHDMPVDRVHFHEVGALDSIIDIVGAAICLHELAVDRIYVSVIELGSGLVRCQHGLLPVPAPATLRIISGLPVHTGGVDFEATTPTGAAILAAVAEPLPPEMNFTVTRCGYGIGHRENPSRPNILRVWLAEPADEVMPGSSARLVECNIDDMNPELSDYISGKLFDAGVHDVWFTPVIMKRGRPAFTLGVICDEEHLEAVRTILFTETTTIGLRVSSFTKEALERRFDEIETPYGKVTVKSSFHKGKLVSLKPEAGRCAEIAAATGIPMKQVIQQITALAHARSGK